MIRIMSLESKPANIIKGIRLSLGLTQAQFAALLGVSKHVVLNWENGRTIPRADKFLLAQRLREKIQRRSGGFVDAVSTCLPAGLEG